MINKTLNDNSANRVETPLKPVEGVVTKTQKNKILFNASQKIMEAGVEIVKISPALASILFNMGDNILKEIDLREDKMPEDEVQNIIDEILSIKKGL